MAFLWNETFSKFIYTTHVYSCTQCNIFDFLIEFVIKFVVFITSHFSSQKHRVNPGDSTQVMVSRRI